MLTTRKRSCQIRCPQADIVKKFTISPYCKRPWSASWRGVLPRRSASAKKQYVFRFLGDALPRSADLVRSNVATDIRVRDTMGIVGLLWSGNAGFTITRAVNLAAGITA